MTLKTNVKIYWGLFKEVVASHNKAFTQQSSPSPLVAKSDFEEVDSGDNPSLANRIAADPPDLKPVRVHECGNVIGNQHNTNVWRIISEVS